MSNPISQCSLPFGWKDLKTNGLSLSHSLAMDSKVKFGKNMHYSSIDFHYKLEALEKLRRFIPHLIDPFLNEYEACRQMSIFPADLPLNADIAQSVSFLNQYVYRPDMNPKILEDLGLLLLAQAFLYKEEISGRKGLDKYQKEIHALMGEVRDLLLMKEEWFKTTRYYANKIAGMNETDFRVHYERIMEMSAKVYWRMAKLDWALYLLLNTDMPIKEISLEAGFYSPKAFHKKFVKHYENPPATYRGQMAGLLFTQF